MAYIVTLIQRLFQFSTWFFYQIYSTNLFCIFLLCPIVFSAFVLFCSSNVPYKCFSAFIMFFHQIRPTNVFQHSSSNHKMMDSGEIICRALPKQHLPWNYLGRAKNVQEEKKIIQQKCQFGNHSSWLLSMHLLNVLAKQDYDEYSYRKSCSAAKSLKKGL